MLDDPLKIIGSIEEFPSGCKEEELLQCMNVLHALKDYYNQIIDLPETLPGLKLHVSANDMANNSESWAKLSWLANVSMGSAPGFQIWTDRDDPTPGAELKDLLRPHAEVFKELSDVTTAKVYFPIPEFIEERDLAHSSDGLVHRYRFDTELVRKAANGALQPLLFNAGKLPGYMSDMQTDDLVPGMISLRFPTTGDLTVNEIASFRRDHADSFLRFQNAVQKFSMTCKKTGSENVILDVLLHIDEEVENLRDEMRSIRSDNIWTASQMSASFGVLGLAFLAPAEVVRAVLAFLGSNSLISNLKNVRVNSLKASESKRHDFYFPLALHEFAKQAR